MLDLHRMPPSDDPRKGARNLLHIRNFDDEQLKWVTDKFRTVRVGSYAGGDWGLASGFTIIGFAGSRSDTGRYEGAEGIVLHVSCSNNPVSRNEWIAEGVLFRLEDEDELHALHNLLMTEMGIPE